MGLAPIALFVYNRPEHTKTTLESLKKNFLIGKSKLFVFCDGPKKPLTEESIAAIASVRKIVDRIDFVGELFVTYRTENLGLSASITHGVNDLVHKEGKIIVLEDDLKLGSNFLKFMNDALDKYENEQSIMHIGGYMPNIGRGFKDVALIRLTHSWGWATWERAWLHFNPDSAYLMDSLKAQNRVREFDYGSTFRFFKMLKRTHEGKRDSWLIKWYASVFLKGGLCLNPTKSLVNNIGHDSSGTHSHTTESFNSQINESRINLKLEKIEEDQFVRRAMQWFYIKQKIFDGPNYHIQNIRNRFKK